MRNSNPYDTKDEDISLQEDDELPKKRKGRTNSKKNQQARNKDVKTKVKRRKRKRKNNTSKSIAFDSSLFLKESRVKTEEECEFKLIIFHVSNIKTYFHFHTHVHKLI